MRFLNSLFILFLISSSHTAVCQLTRFECLEQAIHANANFDFDKSLDLLAQIGHPTSGSDTIYILGQMHRAHALLWTKRSDQFDKTKEELHRYLSNNKLPRFTIRVKQLDAIDYALKHEYKKGLEVLVDAIQEYERTHNNPFPDWQLHEPYLAFLLHFNHHFDSAEELYINYLIKIKKRYPNGSTLENAIRLLLATFYHYQDDQELSTTILEGTKTLCLDNEVCLKVMGSYLCRFQSEFAKDNGEYAKSKQFALEAIELAQNDFQIGIALGKLAISSAYMGHISESQHQFYRGLELIEPAGEQKQVINYIENYARSLVHLGMHEEVIQLYNLANKHLDLSRERTSYGGNTYIIDYLFRYYLQKQNYQQALKHWKEYTCITHKVCHLSGWENPNTCNMPLHIRSVHSLFNKSELTYKAYTVNSSKEKLLKLSIDAGLKADSIAQNLLTKLYDSSSQERFLRTFSEEYNQLIHRTWELYEQDPLESNFNILLYLLSVIDDNELRINRWAQRTINNNPNISSLKTSEDSILSIINHSHSLENLPKLKLKLNEIKFEEKLLDYQKSDYSLEKIASISNPDSNKVTLVYQNFDNSVYIMFVDHEERKAFKTISNTPIDSLITNYRINLMTSISSYDQELEFKKIQSVIKDLIWEPVKSLLNQKEITIVANGTLGTLPFDPLLSDSEQQIKSYNHSYIPLLLEGREYVSTNPSLAIFIPSFPKEELGQDSGVFRSNYLGHLPFAKTEEESIVKAFPQAKILYSKEANKNQLEKALKTNSIVHLITHTKQSNFNIDNSFIALNNNDGNIDSLFYKEYSEMECNADMVVLSSCETAHGPYISGIGIKSFTRSILSQGAKSVVATLWPVNDRSTALIMGEYYKNLEKGMPKSVALSHAKQSYLNTVDENYKHPYYWSGIQVIGDNSPIITNYSYSYHFKPVLLLIIGIFILLIYTYSNQIAAFLS